ncbi:MAG: hypothetical protein ABR508_06885, partial [Candidatus Baltobacteraceae bacterium]
MAFAARLAVLCVLACLTAGAAGPQAAALAPLFARMRAANGGLVNAHIVSTSRHLVDGMPAILTTHVQGLRYRQDQCTGLVCLGTYFDGERLFSVNINDTALPRSSTPEPRLRALRILGMLAFLDPQFEGTVYDGGAAHFLGRTVRRIFVSDRIALPMEIYVNPQTGLVAGAQDVNGDAVYVMRDYRRVGAFVLPFEIDRSGAPLERYLTRRVEAAPFNAPQGLHAQEIAGALPAMALDPQSILPLGTCTVAGISVACLIDSGNSALSMSVELAEQLNLKPVGMLRVAGLGNYATEVVRAGPLKLADKNFGDANYVVLSDIHRYGYDIVIGADALATMPVTIDYQAHALYFGQNVPVSAAAATVPLAFQNLVPVVSVILNDSLSSLAVDTGDQSNINLGYEYYREHSQLFQATKMQSVSGVGGESVELM